jgi:hypothetical protein
MRLGSCMSTWSECIATPPAIGKGLMEPRRCCIGSKLCCNFEIRSVVLCKTLNIIPIRAVFALSIDSCRPCVAVRPTLHLTFHGEGVATTGDYIYPGQSLGEERVQPAYLGCSSSELGLISWRSVEVMQLCEPSASLQAIQLLGEQVIQPA